jgi:hypothetical protein
MKKIKLIIALCALVSLNAVSQPWVTTQFTSQDYFLSSGSVCTATRGIMMAGYSKTYSATNSSFRINRTDTGGTITGLAAVFSRTYTVNHATASCVGPTTVATTCKGVSLIETALTFPSRPYALAGATDKGAFFTSLLFSGAPHTTTGFYRFPSGSFGITQPLIVESTAGLQYFICGSYSIATAGAFMYVLKVDGDGVILNSNTYQIASGKELIPRDMIVSPYTPNGTNELIVVGKAHDFSGNNGSPNNKAFFMRLKQSDITTISCSLYGQLSTYANPNDWFSAVTVANSSTGGDGFVVAGHSDSINTAPVWVEKLSRTGTPTWSHLFNPHYDNSQSVDPVGVIERYSTHYSSYMYYAATTSSTGMVVLKLDDNGDSYTSTTPVDNASEFKYQANTGNFPTTVDLSYLNNGGSHDQGIHVFGYYDNTNGQMFLATAPFNGFINSTAPPCDNSATNTITSQSSGPIRSGTVGITMTSGLTKCSIFSITSGTVAVLTNTYCANHFTIAGQISMNKESLTSLTELKEMNDFFNIYPNPANEKIQIEFKAPQKASLEIKLLDVLGRFIANLPVPESITEGKQSFEIDLGKFALKNGIYFLSTNLNGKEYRQKLIYNQD